VGIDEHGAPSAKAAAFRNRLLSPVT